jgi:hypothetical protein
MTRTRKLCLALDVAAFVGLGLFLLAYFLREPRPMWTAEVPLLSNVIGYSADSRKLYTLSDTDIRGDHLPKPRIQRWDVETGRLEENVAVQVPDEELGRVLPIARGGMAQHFWGSMPFDQHVLHLNQRASERGTLFRMYEPDTGKRLFDQPAALSGESFHHGVHRDDGRYVGIFLRTSVNSAESGLKVRDLTAAAALCEIRPKAGQWFVSAMLLDPGRHFAVVTRVRSGKDAWQYGLDIYAVTGGEPVASKDLGTWVRLERHGYHFQPTDGGDFLLYCQVDADQKGPRSVVERYSFDAETQSLIERKDSPHYGRVLEGMSWIVGDTLRSWSHTSTGWWHGPSWTWLHDLLGRVGIRLPQGADFSNLYVRDFYTGALLRQVTGLPGTSCCPSPDGHSLALVGPSLGYPEQQYPRIAVYPIRHHLWEWTWITLKYAAWLLVLPWPLRIYLIRTERRRLNAGKVLAEQVLSSGTSGRTS